MTQEELQAIRERCENATPGWDETWKAIDGTDELYEVSDIGNVRSKLKPGNHRNKIGMPRLLKLQSNGNGYLTACVPIGDAKKYQHITVHKLVAQAFLGACPDGMEVAHLNGEKTDNRLSNLKYVTHKENESHKRDHGTVAMGERNGSAKLLGWQVAEIKFLALKGIPQIKISQLFDLPTQTISEIVIGTRWDHIASREDVPKLLDEVQMLQDALSWICAVAHYREYETDDCLDQIERKALEALGGDSQ